MLFDLISSFRLFNRSQFMRALLFDAQKKKRKRKYPVYINSLLGLFRLFPMFLCLKKFSKTVPSPSERNNREKGEWSEKDEQSIERNEVTPRINYSKWTSVVDGGSIKSRKLLEGRWRWRGGLTSRLRRLCFQRLSIRRIDDKTRFCRSLSLTDLLRSISTNICICINLFSRGITLFPLLLFTSVIA